MSLDWRRLRAVVIESDDWGLCAWSPDEQGHRVLTDSPAFRSPAGRRYAGSTLESAADLSALTETLLEFRGGDGFPPVWQANTVMAAPDYARMRPPLFDLDELPLITLPDTPSRWRRPGAWQSVKAACEAGLWWPELHGLHHLPERAWLVALRRGESDARRAFDQQSPVCAAVEASGEYDPREPQEQRTRCIERSVALFQERFGRLPGSLCPPDYRWDDHLESDASRLGVPVIQGKAEQAGTRFPRLRQLAFRMSWPRRSGARFYMPARQAFEPSRSERAMPAAEIEAMRRAARQAWGRGQPFVVSTHRLNYVHLDPARAAAGRAALRDLLRGLTEDGAAFLVDTEVRQLESQGWSVRELGSSGMRLRHHGVPRQPLRFPARDGARGVAVVEGPGAEDAQVAIEGSDVVARVNVGAYRLEWKDA